MLHRIEADKDHVIYANGSMADRISRVMTMKACSHAEFVDIITEAFKGKKYTPPPNPIDRLSKTSIDILNNAILEEYHDFLDKENDTLSLKYNRKTEGT